MNNHHSYFPHREKNTHTSFIMRGWVRWTILVSTAVLLACIVFFILTNRIRITVDIENKQPNRTHSQHEVVMFSLLQRIVSFYDAVDIGVMIVINATHEGTKNAITKAFPVFGKDTDTLDGLRSPLSRNAEIDTSITAPFIVNSSSIHQVEEKTEIDLPLVGNPPIKSTNSADIITPTRSSQDNPRRVVSTESSSYQLQDIFEEGFITPTPTSTAIQSVPVTPTLTPLQPSIKPKTTPSASHSPQSDTSQSDHLDEDSGLDKTDEKLIPMHTLREINNAEEINIDTIPIVL